MNQESLLVRPLFDGPIDIVGDVHGEIEALNDLLGHLGYANDGQHSEGRRLVFLGDLTDRGPDSPAVVERVKSLMDAGRAQCVLGNHELNILLEHKKHDNHWFFGEKSSLAEEGEPITPAVLADEETRRQLLAFFSTLPLALEREDVRVVHACWDAPMIDLAREATDTIALLNHHGALIDADLEKSPSALECDDDPQKRETMRHLQRQNRNPVKVLCSGKEQTTKTPFWASGKLRYEERVKWWQGYGPGNPLCVFGHYSIYRDKRTAEDFARQAICADFAVAYRWKERTPDFAGTFRGRLGAMRLPERIIVFDNGDIESLPKVGS